MEAKEIIDFAYFEQNELEDLEEDSYDQFIQQEKARRLMENSQFNEAIEVLEELVDQYPEL